MGTGRSVPMLFAVWWLLMSCCRGCVLHTPKESNDTISDVESVHVDVAECCTGYRWVEEERRCEVCADWTFGTSCRESCSCVRNNTRVCGHITGVCLCHPLWTGTACSLPVEVKRKGRSTGNDENALVPENISTCPAWYFGVNCTDMCSCNQTTSVSCNSTNGGCNCGPGYTGSQCSQECDNTTFGENCSQSCRCDPINSLACSHVDGTCDCSTGWTGTYCNQTCSDGTFGDRCGSNCSCHTNASPACNHFNGLCSCITGYVMVGDACLQIDTGTVTPLSVFLAVFDNPVYVCIITAGFILLLVAVILCILWKICRCSCAEVKNRKHRLGDPKPLVSTPTEPATKGAIAALANITTKSIKQETELDVPTSAVYGASLDVTGKPPIADGANYYYRDTLQQSFPSTTPLLVASQQNLIDPSLDAYPYYKTMKAASVSTFKLNEDKSEDSQTDVRISINPNGNIYYNDVRVLPFQASKVASSQPNISKYPGATKDVTFDDVISALSKKKGFQNGKTNLKKMNSRSMPNIDRGDLDATRQRSFTTHNLYTNYRSDPNMKQTKLQDSALSIYDDTAVSNSSLSLNSNVASSKPTYIGAKKATRIVPIPVAPPVVTIPHHHETHPPPLSDIQKLPTPVYGNAIQNGGMSSESNTVSNHPPPPPISNIPTFTHIYRNDMRSGDTNISHSASYNNVQNIPLAPPIMNIPKQRLSDVREGEVMLGKGTGGQHYDDTAVKSLPKQPSESIYDNIDQGPGISRQNRFSSGVYAELK